MLFLILIKKKTARTQIGHDTSRGEYIPENTSHNRIQQIQNSASVHHSNTYACLAVRQLNATHMHCHTKSQLISIQTDECVWVCL